MPGTAISPEVISKAMLTAAEAVFPQDDSIIHTIQGVFPDRRDYMYDELAWTYGRGVQENFFRSFFAHPDINLANRGRIARLMARVNTPFIAVNLSTEAVEGAITQYTQAHYGREVKPVMVSYDQDIPYTNPEITAPAIIRSELNEMLPDHTGSLDFAWNQASGLTRHLLDRLGPVKRVQQAAPEYVGLIAATLVAEGLNHNQSVEGISAKVKPLIPLVEAGLHLAGVYTLMGTERKFRLGIPPWHLVTTILDESFFIYKPTAALVAHLGPTPDFRSAPQNDLIRT